MASVGSPLLAGAAIALGLMRVKMCWIKCWLVGQSDFHSLPYCLRYVR
jgi:hypothetical protein